MINAYDLIADVRPDQLTELTEAAIENPDMELELQEEMYIAKILCPEGEVVKGGVPMALLCEMEEDIEQARSLAVWSIYSVALFPFPYLLSSRLC